MEQVERVLGHEFHHVFAARYLYPGGRAFDTWQETWKDRIIRQIVSEGVAMQCDVREGMRKAVIWIAELNREFAALDDGTITPEDAQKWYVATFHDTARGLLRDYLSREYPDENTDEKLRENITSRPSLVYTLGWWMISRILQTENGKEAVIGLLSQPYDVFPLYNSTLSADQTALRADVRTPY